MPTRTVSIALLVVLVLALLAPLGSVHAASDIAGKWSGQIDTPGMALRISVNFTRAQVEAEDAEQADAQADTGWAGTVDIPQQGAKDLPLMNVTVEGERVRFAIDKIPGDPAFDGKLNETGDAIAGDFTQGTFKTTFSLKRGELEKIVRPQDPKPPFPYDVIDLSVPVGAPNAPAEDGKPRGHFLAGTITKPKGDGPFPAAILISGSGPQNRDEELLDHRPFAVLADHLTRAGVLVLRYDDRGVGASGGDFAGATMRDFADDAEACLRYLRGRTDVGPVGLIGHSEGGRVAPMVAARSADVKFLVLLAAPSVPGRELLVRQNELMMLAAGAAPDAAEDVRRAADALFSELKPDTDRERIMQLLRDLVAAQTAATGQTELDDEQKKMRDEALGQQAEAIFTPWFLDFVQDDPRPDLLKVRCPVLAITGERDVQVDPKQNLPPIETALKEARNQDATVKELPGLNHLFQFVANGSPALYAVTPETMNPKALQTVSEWIKARFIEPGAPDAPTTAPAAE